MIMQSVDVCFCIDSEQVVRGVERCWRRREHATGERRRRWRRQVVRRVRAAAPALRVPAARRRAAQLPAVRPSRHTRQDEQPSFLMDGLPRSTRRHFDERPPRSSIDIPN